MTSSPGAVEGLVERLEGRHCLSDFADLLRDTKEAAARLTALSRQVEEMRAGIDTFCLHFILAHDDSSDFSDLRSEDFRLAVRDLAALSTQKGSSDE